MEKSDRCHPIVGVLQQLSVISLGAKSKILLLIRIKILEVPGVGMLKCHPYRQIPIVIHGFLPEASSFSFYPNCPEQLAHLRAIARVGGREYVNGQTAL